MSARELRRAEVLGRVKGQTLRLVDAAKMLEVSYRQAKRLWQRYREEGAKGLQHRSAGRSSNRAKPEKFRRKVLQLVREKYSGTEQERFGLTLAAEHLAEEDALDVGRRRCDAGCWRRGYGALCVPRCWQSTSGTLFHPFLPANCSASKKKPSTKTASSSFAILASSRLPKRGESALKRPSV
jgi:transposase